MYEWCDTLNCLLASAFKHIVLKPQRLFYAFHDKLKGIKLGSFFFKNSSLHIISVCSTDREHSSLFVQINEIFDTKERKKKNPLCFKPFLSVGY